MHKRPPPLHTSMELLGVLALPSGNIRAVGKINKEQSEGQEEKADDEAG